MSNNSIREPKQKRSIEKKRKIIEAGFKLMCEKGYHNTNSVEIGKAAGVSTGIIYNYFTDKKDIFIAAIQDYANNLTSPMFEKISTLKEPIDLTNLLNQFIDIFIQSHCILKSTHEEITAMAHSDKDVANLFYQFEIDTTNTLIDLMKQKGITPTNPREKVHISIGLIENLCHERAYHKHDSMDYVLMTDEVINLVISMLTN